MSAVSEHHNDHERIIRRWGTKITPGEEAEMEAHILGTVAVIHGEAQAAATGD